MNRRTVDDHRFWCIIKQGAYIRDADRGEEYGGRWKFHGLDFFTNASVWNKTRCVYSRVCKLSLTHCRTKKPINQSNLISWSSRNRANAMHIQFGQRWSAQAKTKDISSCRGWGLQCISNHTCGRKTGSFIFMQMTAIWNASNDMPKAESICVADRVREFPSQSISCSAIVVKHRISLLRFIFNGTHDYFLYSITTSQARADIDRRCIEWLS